MYVTSIIMVFLLGFGNVGNVCGLKCYACAELAGPTDKQCGSNTPTETCKLRKNTDSDPDSGIYRDEPEADANQTTAAEPELTEPEEESIEPITGETTWERETKEIDYPETTARPSYIGQYINPVCSRTTDGNQLTMAGCMEKTDCENAKKGIEAIKSVAGSKYTMTTTCCETDLCNRAINGKPIGYTSMITGPVLSLVIVNALF